MTQNSLNILDLAQVSPNKGEAGRLESHGQADALNPAMQDTSFDMIFGNMLASLSPEQVVQNSQNQENQALPQLVTDPQMLDTEIDELLSQNTSIKNINIKKLLTQQSTELENGQFKVISKEIEDSKLSLVIEGSNGKQISISLPLDSIKNSSIVEQRVSFEDTYYRNELKSLIEKVDIKQIEIKSADTKLSHSALKPVEISFLGEQNASTIQLKASLKKNQIKITDNTLSANSKAAVLDESGVWGDKVNVIPRNPNKLIENLMSVSKEEIGNGLLGNKLDVVNGTQKGNSLVNLQSSALKQPVDSVNSFFYNYNTDKVDSATLKENMQAVRMQLPDNIKSVLQPNGQALVIRMNPENLGPAKLSLTLHDGKLQAKLMVSSENAKQILDSSLTRLVDQLHKADVLIDKIDVTVDDNKNKNEQFNQKQQWQRKMSHKNIDLDQFEQDEIERSVLQPMRSTIQSVSSNGVNYLA